MVVRLTPFQKALVLIKSYWFLGGLALMLLSILLLTGAISSVFRYFFTIVIGIAAIALMHKSSKGLRNMALILADCTLTYAELWKNEKTEFSREGGGISLRTGSLGGEDERAYHQLTFLYVVNDKPFFEYYTTSTPERFQKQELLVYSNKNPNASSLLFNLPRSIAVAIERQAGVVNRAL